MSKDPSSVELRVSALEAERDRLAARVDAALSLAGTWEAKAQNLAARVSELEAALREIADMDYRGNRSPEMEIARAALDKETLPPGTVVQFDPDEETPQQAVERAALDKDLAATFDEEPE